jgi:hypothetical protein
MSEKLCIHEDCTPGLTTSGQTVTEIHNSYGQHYWKAVEQIRTIFGSEVEGEISAIGATREKCLENLSKERRELHESLWL